MAAMRAAGRLDRHDLHRIRRAVANLAMAVDAGRPTEILRTDRVIHTLIYGVAGGDFLERTIEPVNDVVTLLSPQTLALKDRARCVLDEHRNLLIALESRDVVGAEHWSVEHVKSARLAALNISWTWGRVDGSPLRAWAYHGHAGDGPSVRVD
jgi:DNA-binding GntR family transcriptional regulator